MQTNDKKVALVTGASSGIGKTTAKMLNEAGFITFATARRTETLTELQQEGCQTLALDVTDENSMMTAVQAVESEYGAISVLVNNAGYNLPGPLEELAINDVRQQFETNVFGMLRMCQLALPRMREQGFGRIINIGSVGGTFTTPGSGAYHMSKFAVESLCDALRYEVRPFGIDVVLIQPTGVRTPFVEKLFEIMPQTGEQSPYAGFKKNLEKQIEQMFAGNAFGILAAEDVAKTIVGAVLARRPRTRYKVGVSAHIFSAMRTILPDRAWDALMAQTFPFEEKIDSKAVIKQNSVNA